MKLSLKKKLKLKHKKRIKKKTLSKNECTVGKQEWACPFVNGLGNRFNLIESFAECAQWVLIKIVELMNSIFMSIITRQVFNAWCENNHIKTDFINTIMLFLEIHI